MTCVARNSKKRKVVKRIFTSRDSSPQSVGDAVAQSRAVLRIDGYGSLFQVFGYWGAARKPASEK